METVQRLCVVLLLVAVSAWSAQCAELDWKLVSGSLKSVSGGQAGVWGADKDGKVLFRTGTYGNPGKEGGDWEEITGSLVQLDVGKNVVWGVNSNDKLYYRNGISLFSPKGTIWKSISGSAKHVTVAPSGQVWCVNSKNDVYFRKGVTSSQKGGTSWAKVTGQSLKQISAGKAGVWGVGPLGAVYFRAGSFGDFDVDNQGSAWKKVDGTMKYVSSGDGVVLAINSKNEIFYRTGVSFLRPQGLSWSKMNGKLVNVDAYDKDTAWGVNVLNMVYQGAAA